MDKKHVEIVICKKCEGCGGLARYRKPDEIGVGLVRSVCTECLGSGRVRITTLTEPYMMKVEEE